MSKVQKKESYLMRRVKTGVDGKTTSVEFDHHVYKQTVFLHLQKIFNIRQGSCLANPDYGLPDFNDLDMKYGFSIAVKEVVKAIKENIEKYESGLKRVRVNFVRDETKPLELRFEIVGVLTARGLSERVRLETRKSSSGILEVV
ncbi:type VI secretion system baseplate subunit TssE [Rheinheimera maricola]|uniref:Type VI secretion system baseplate subunit TssE n=1 Tax=Rheinheimera maricola TaxID=2793282 RepID=A0ABS7XCY0_9GAMM|nr:type VI secretion system baseplate subunit TssE [Rheinheimera maricola]MBZ9613414.1 type VI secretion system baseplate subunit TssE [Rheinheimera maricola]